MCWHPVGLIVGLAILELMMNLLAKNEKWMHGMQMWLESLTSCQVIGPEWKDGEKRPSWTWHEITHFLSIQQEKSGCEDSKKSPSWSDIMKPLTPCQANSTRIIIVRDHSLQCIH